MSTMQWHETTKSPYKLLILFTILEIMQTQKTSEASMSSDPTKSNFSMKYTLTWSADNNALTIIPKSGGSFSFLAKPNPATETNCLCQEHGLLQRELN